MNLFDLIKRVFNNPFIKFLFVAGINTGFGYLLFAITVYILKNAYVSTIVSTIIAILFNFKTYGAIVFKSKDNSKIFRFFGVYLCTMGLQLAAFKVFAGFGITNPYIVAGIMTLPLAGVSFLLMRRFVFTAAEKRG